MDPISTFIKNKYTVPPLILLVTLVNWTKLVIIGHVTDVTCHMSHVHNLSGEHVLVGVLQGGAEPAQQRHGVHQAAIRHHTALLLPEAGDNMALNGNM